MMGQSWLNHGPQQPNGRYPRCLVDIVVVPHGSALIWLSWIRIRADPDPGARKFIKINKSTWFPAFVGMLLPYSYQYLP